MNRLRLIVLVLVVSSVVSRFPVHAGHWPTWRGPQGNSVSTETGLPTEWGVDSENITTIPLPEWGTSTPAIWNDAAFVTSESDGKLLLIRIDIKTGEKAWVREVGRGTAVRKGEGKRSSKFHNLHNLASPSPITDGERVVVHFGNGVLASYTFDGEKEWSRNLVTDFGPYSIWWGHANSPVFFGDLVISVCMQDPLDGVKGRKASSYVVAHDKQTGKQVWLTKRRTNAHAEEGDSYTTPIFHQRGDTTEMVVMGGNELDAYDPKTGKRLWHLTGLKGGRTITGPTLSEGTVWTTVGMRGPLYAVSLEKANSNSLEDAQLWKATKSTPDSCCPVVVNGLVFWVADNGIATCCDAKTGEVQWQERLKGRNFKASPVAADGKIYFLAHDGYCTVIKAEAKFERLAENRIEDEFAASPAIVDGTLILRGRTALYLIGS